MKRIFVSVSSMRTVFTILLLAVALSIVSASASDSNVIFIDKRTATSSTGRSVFVSFCAEPASDTSTFGHAYVMTGYIDRNSKIHNETGNGFYALSDGDYVFRGVPGDVLSEYLPALLPEKQCRVLVLVDSLDGYNEVLEKFKKTKYRLSLNDCVSMTRAIANKVGLETTLRINSLTPDSFIKQLIQANKGTAKPLP